jgi:hypothetical protein
MTTKFCKDCAKDLPVEAFAMRRRRDTVRRNYLCIPCQRAADFARNEGRKAPPSTLPSKDWRCNSAAELWHGPVNRDMPLRWAA